MVPKKLFFIEIQESIQGILWLKLNTLNCFQQSLVFPILVQGVRSQVEEALAHNLRLNTNAMQCNAAVDSQAECAGFL